MKTKAFIMATLVAAHSYSCHVMTMMTNSHLRVL